MGEKDDMIECVCGEGAVGYERAEFDRFLASVKAEARAEGTRESAAYIKRLYPAGLVNRADVLADMEIAADRQSQRIYANGRDRADEAESAPSHIIEHAQNELEN